MQYDELGSWYWHVLSYLCSSGGFEGSSPEFIEMSCGRDWGGHCRIMKKDILNLCCSFIPRNTTSKLLIVWMCAGSNVFLHFSDIIELYLLLHEDFVFQCLPSFMNIDYFCSFFCFYLGCLTALWNNSYQNLFLFFFFFWHLLQKNKNQKSVCVT